MYPTPIWNKRDIVPSLWDESGFIQDGTKREEAVSVGDINSPSPSFSSSPSCSVASRVPRSEAPPYSYHSGSPSPSPHRLAPPPPPWLPGGPGTQSHNTSHTASSTTMHNIVYLFQICSTFLY